MPSSSTRWYTSGGMYGWHPILHLTHSVWKSPEKSHSTLRAKRATLYLSGQKLIKMPKMVRLDEFLKSWSLQSKSVTRQDKIESTTIWVIFKHCVTNATLWSSIFKSITRNKSKITPKKKKTYVVSTSSVCNRILSTINEILRYELIYCKRAKRAAIHDDLMTFAAKTSPECTFRTW